MDNKIEDLTSSCIRCGFCLEACPTFRQTGDEGQSPRGRIYQVRQAHEGNILWPEIAHNLDTCLGCRACETACPSAVQYGQILELAREELTHHRSSKPLELMLNSMTQPSRFKLQIKLAKGIGLKKVPTLDWIGISDGKAQATLPTPQKIADWGEEPPVTGENGPAYVLGGCVMSVLFERVHQATIRLLKRAGYEPIWIPDKHCCGALHAHSGYLTEARKRAADLIKSVPQGGVIVVNSAGCGSTIKEYPHLMACEDAAGFSKRTKDISEILNHPDFLQKLQSSPGIDAVVTYHDACHLVHGQNIAKGPRSLLNNIPKVQCVELPKADECCGSAGIYNLQHPDMARALLEEKWKNIEATGAQIVAMGNPGCHAWIDQAAREYKSAIKVMHTAELLECSFSGLYK